MIAARGTIEARRSALWRRRADGVVVALGGLVEFDPRWRERASLAALEPATLGRQLSAAELAALRPVETGIEFVCGKPGGGKSMFATKLVLEELIHGFRPIVTNLALNLARLQEYLIELGHMHVHVVERVRLLEKEEITEFYLRRGVDFTLSLPPDGERFMDWTPSQRDARSAGGVMYVIDECHNYLHPQAFGQKLTPEHPLMQWATQHRKLKDTCYLVTQSVENVHVQVRRLGQQFVYVRNERKETFKGFRRGDGFRTTTYLVPPTSDAAVPIDSKPFRLDVRGLASCYHTAGGVGIAAQGVGDGGAKKRGLNLRWIYVFGVLGLVAAGGALWLGSEVATDALVGATVGASVGKGSQPRLNQVQPVRERETKTTDLKPAVPVEYYDGLIVDGDRVRVAVRGEWCYVVGRMTGGMLVLEDGRVVAERRAALPSPAGS